MPLEDNSLYRRIKKDKGKGEKYFWAWQSQLFSAIDITFDIDKTCWMPALNIMPCLLFEYIYFLFMFILHLIYSSVSKIFAAFYWILEKYLGKGKVGLNHFKVLQTPYYGITQDVFLNQLIFRHNVYIFSLKLVQWCLM